jgi:hypothetical protein
VSGKDPHSEVANTVNTLIDKLNNDVEKDEQAMLQNITDADTEPVLPAHAVNSVPSQQHLRTGDFEFGEWAAGNAASKHPMPPLMLPPPPQHPSHAAQPSTPHTPMYGLGMISPQAFPSFTGGASNLGMGDGVLTRIEPSNSQLQLMSLGLEPSAPSYFYAWNRFANQQIM